MEKENIWPVEEKKHIEGKGEKYFEKENTWLWEEKKNRKGGGAIPLSTKHCEISQVHS